MYTAAQLALLRAMDPNQIPGVDTPVGALSNPAHALSSLPTSGAAGVFYDAATNVVYLQQAGAVLDGYDFGNATIMVDASNVTIENSTFQAAGKEIFAVQLASGADNVTIKNNT